MVFFSSILSSNLALSLLRHSSPSSQSFVISPFSLNTALAIVHDGANGTTQKELTDLLHNGCTPYDVTRFYSSLAVSLPSTNATGVAFKSANRFYLDDSISLKKAYQKHVENKYRVKVQNLNLDDKFAAEKQMNKFSKAYLINAIYFLGKWTHPFEQINTRHRQFNGYNGMREMKFMSRAGRFRVDQTNDFGTALIMPYQDEKYSFFYLMPNEFTDLYMMRVLLTGDQLLNILKSAKEEYIEISVPKFKVHSKLDGISTRNLLLKMGVKSIFDNADLSKISSTPFVVGEITHEAMLETDELGTEAAAATVINFAVMSMPFYKPPKSIIIDHPFLFGIIRDDDILFLGQYV